MSHVRDISASEIVMMDVNAFNVTNDFYPSAREEVSSSVLDNTRMQRNQDPDLESIMQHGQVPRSHVELDKIN